MQVKQGDVLVVPFFDKNGEVGAGPLIVSVYDVEGAALVEDVAMLEVPDVQDVYLSASIPFPDTGSFVAHFKVGADILGVLPVEVGLHPISSYPLGVLVTISTPITTVGGAPFVALLLLGDDGTGERTPAVVTDICAAEVTFEGIGQYFPVWMVADAEEGPFNPILMDDPLYICQTTGLETVHITAGSTPSGGNNGSPHMFATVVVNTLEGAYVAQGVTDIAGDLVLEMAPGTYVFTLIKSGSYYSTNNFEFTISNSSVVRADPLLYPDPSGVDVQAVQLISEVFVPTTTTPVTPPNTCVLYADLFQMDGSPLWNTSVAVSLVTRPELFSGAGVFDTKKVYKTDSNGHVEFSLVQGIKIEVAIAPLGIRRIVTVPSGAEAVDPVNLLTLLSGADDPFDVITPAIPFAERRSL